VTRWPALPKAVQGAGGPIRIKLVTRERADDGRECWGTWEASTRIIRIVRGAPRQHQWRVYHHEWMHSCLDDSGIAQLLSDAGNEALCEAYASAQMADMLATADRHPETVRSRESRG